LTTKGNSDEMRRRELAAFLSKKRKCLAPPRRAHASQRRLTPGLRREEVAEIAGVGTTWYTWLEQARDIRPSERTLRRIARALQLDKPETKYLLDLGLEHRLRPSGDEPVAREVMLILKAMSTPAYLLGRTGNLLAYNGAANALLDLDYMPGPNFFKVLFAAPARALFANWAEYARHAVAVFRTRNADALGDPAMVEIIAELSRQSHEFAEWWAEHAISALRAINAELNHPFVGHLAFDNACMRVEEHPGLSLIALITEHEETRKGVSELVRQLERGEHDATHNVWHALGADQPGDACHSQHP
jgi:transcriptional regulator with XRE-family HTH domain